MGYPLLGLLTPSCDACGVLRCYRAPRCGELAEDTEAGALPKRCGGACGGTMAYRCAAGQGRSVGGATQGRVWEGGRGSSGGGRG